MDRIRNGGFLCFPSSPNAVTYRAELHGTLKASVPDLIEDITEWLSSGASISVQFQLLTIDSSCSVAITSFNENECRNTVTMTTTVTGNEGSTTSVSQNYTGVVIGVAIGVIVAIAVAITIIILVIVILHHKNHRDTIEMTTK